jgi:hypothetical protein
MRQRYNHLLPLSQDALDRVWDDAILTLDANVLLDLYRYHEQTRTGLIQALEQFKGRLWLSHQAAEEFFRNRTTVIANAEKDFDDAEAQFKQVLAAADRFRAFRLVPRELISTLASGLKREVEAAQVALKTARDLHPNYLNDDPLLEQILNLFEGSVGPEPSEPEHSVLRKEGERRQIQKIPPDFSDDKKDGEKPLGDYFLWAQVLAHARTEGKPILLVTSEKKDDWWEKHRGRRFPRRELLE